MVYCQTCNGHCRCMTKHNQNSNRCIFCRWDQKCKSTLLFNLRVFFLMVIRMGWKQEKHFYTSPSTIEAKEAEEISIEHLLWDIKNSTMTTLATQVNKQLASLWDLQSQLSDVQKYLVEVSTGIIPVNHQIMYHLQDALNLLPNLTDTNLIQSFTMSTNNQMLVVYLSSLLCNCTTCTSGQQGNYWAYWT